MKPLLTLTIATLLTWTCIAEVRTVNLYDEFAAYYQDSIDLNEAAQVALFVERIEAQQQQFYNQHIYHQQLAPESFEARRESIRSAQIRLHRSVDLSRFTASYQNWEEAALPTLARVQYTFPSYDPDLTIMLIPGISWGGSYIRTADEEYIALGTDLLARDPQAIPNLETLITHELMHDLHAQFRAEGNTSERQYLEEGQLFWQLWDEGMANWASTHVTGASEVFGVIDTEIDPAFEMCRIGALAARFTNEMNLPAIDFDQPSQAKKWFGTARDTAQLGEHTPSMIGYIMGAMIIAELEAEHGSIEVLMSWDYATAKPHIQAGLARLRATYQCAEEP